MVYQRLLVERRGHGNPPDRELLEADRDRRLACELTHVTEALKVVILGVSSSLRGPIGILAAACDWHRYLLT